ncbi:hypothetical protein RQP46_002452 [Phenoliferia psychrophenolica]
MSSDQDDAWSIRVEGAKARARHIKSLSSLALVNKELRELAAVHQFEFLSADRALLPVFRYSILRRWGHHVKTLNFYHSESLEAAELALSLMGQLPGLRTLHFSQRTATELFGPGVTLSTDLEDEAASYRASEFASHTSRIEDLTLMNFKPSETVALVRACVNLKTLFLLEMTDPEEGEDLHEVASAIASRHHLVDLALEMEVDATGAWPIEAFAPLVSARPPIKFLQLTNFPLNLHTFSIIDTFSSTLQSLLLNPRAQDVPFDLTSCGPLLLLLPHLTTLDLTASSEQLPHFLRLLTSSSALSCLWYHSLPGEPIDPMSCTFDKCIASQPSLTHLHLWGSHVDESPSPSFLVDYDTVVFTHGLNTSVLDQPHLTPFHPKAKLDYTETEQPFLSQSLRRTLEFGLGELDRMDAERDVAKALRWVPKLRELEEERLMWKD